MSLVAKAGGGWSREPPTLSRLLWKSSAESRLIWESSLGLGISGSRPWDSAYLGVVPGTRHILESSLGLGMSGAACPNVLKGSGARVSLPVAHYPDSILVVSFVCSG